MTVPLNWVGKLKPSAAKIFGRAEQYRSAVSAPEHVIAVTRVSMPIVTGLVALDTAIGWRLDRCVRRLCLQCLDTPRDQRMPETVFSNL